MTARELQIHVARVQLAECARRRHGPLDRNGRNVNRDFYWLLFGYAQTCRRRAAAMAREPKQEALFA
jgi:hypothetical protein